MLRSVGSGLTIGLAVGLPPLYYDLIRETVDIMDFLIVEVPAVGVLFDNLQVQFLEEGRRVTYAFVIDGFPKYFNPEVTLEEHEALRALSELTPRCRGIDSAFQRLGTLTQEIERYSPSHPGSICDDLNVQASWARARR